MDKRIKNKMDFNMYMYHKTKEGYETPIELPKHQLNCRYVYLRSCVGNVTHLAETWQQIHIRTRKVLVHL